MTSKDSRRFCKETEMHAADGTSFECLHSGFDRAMSEAMDSLGVNLAAEPWGALCQAPSQEG